MCIFLIYIFFHVRARFSLFLLPALPKDRYKVVRWNIQFGSNPGLLCTFIHIGGPFLSWGKTIKDLKWPLEMHFTSWLILSLRIFSFLFIQFLGWIDRVGGTLALFAFWGNCRVHTVHCNFTKSDRVAVSLVRASSPCISDCSACTCLRNLGQE